MKKFSIIGLAIVFLFVIALLWIHFKHPSDQQIQRELVGTWVFSGTTNENADHSTETMSTETEYHADGTFDTKIELGRTAPIHDSNMTVYIMRDGVRVPESEEYPFRRQMGGQGIWRIEHGHFFSTLTNSIGDWRIEAGRRTIIQTNTASMQTNLEQKDEIISITRQNFTKRDKIGRVQTATRK